MKIGTMATNRLGILRQMVDRDPANSFARYGLAMEIANAGDYAAAISEFKELLRRDEDYAAAYFHAGQASEKTGDVEEARHFYEKGIAVTTRKGDAHTRSEIEAALSMLPI